MAEVLMCDVCEEVYALDEMWCLEEDEEEHDICDSCWEEIENDYEWDE